MMEKSYADVAENIARIREEIAQAAQKAGRSPDEVQLMAVTKTVPAETVNAAIACGIRLLGENRAQELREKYPLYDKEAADIHFIGHLQSNKVRQIIDKVTMIHSVDRFSLAEEISARAQALGRVMDILLEVNIGDEDTKSGVHTSSVEELSCQVAQLPGICVRGLMAIPPVSDNFLQTERYFSSMRQLFVDIQAKKIDNVPMDVLSMGMSGDYTLAVKHGSHIVRLGTAIFGHRDYSKKV